MKRKYFLSICVISYNRPKELKRLLESIDYSSKDLEVLVREDMSPLRAEVRDVVEAYKASSTYQVSYIENETNYGYDKNLRNAAKVAKGEWIIIMGDDDVFVQGNLDKYVNFLKAHENLGYVLRRYYSVHSDGKLEDFRYEKKDVFFEAAEATAIELFRRSLFISGFTFRKKYFDDYDTSDFDGTLLFQTYIVCVICTKYLSAYSDIPITQSFEGGIPYFGKSESEKKFYDSGENSIRGSLNFMKQVRVLAEGTDQKINTHMADAIIYSYSKYSYGFLQEHREEGIKIWNKYVKELKKIGFASSPYFHIYYLMLLILGKKGSRNCIMAVKKIVGKTPRL